MTEIDVLGVPITDVGLDGAVGTVDDWISSGGRGYACLVNVHLVETARCLPPVRAALRGADLNLPDGAPVAWLASRIGNAPLDRVTGSDLFAALCSTAARRHFFLGSTTETLARLTRAVAVSYPLAEICGSYAPPFGALNEGHSTEMIDRANEAAADIVWVGLGAPRQELWMHGHRDRLDAPALIGIGAVFDFASGTKHRAPEWMQHAGLEWAHRLGSEPRRLAGRYLNTNPIFAVRAANELRAQHLSSRVTK